ncbi:hypothetical protein KY285_023628 [Solanum tuberosum]|nr:hypothetical protein KY289_023960 [Solanum tuberosum]KAH0675827.1 hypothetical protein KY285_023628 [Solanum tuberosum]
MWSLSFIGDINYTIHDLIKVKFDYTTIPYSWPQMVALLDGYRPNGASRGNPGSSVAAFYVRNYEGDLVGAKGVKLAESTSLVVEAMTIKEGLQYCWENNYLNIILESNSLAMVQILNGIWGDSLECDNGGQLHQQAKRGVISKSTTLLKGGKYSDRLFC